MCKLPQLLIALSSMVAASVAQAVPTAFYDRPTGNVYLQNDSVTAIPIIVLESPSGRLIGTPNDLAGIVEEFEGAPTSLAYFNVLPTDPSYPPNLNGLYDLGQLVLDGELAGDLSLKYLGALLDFVPGRVAQIPESSALAMAGIGVGMLHFVHRKAAC